MSEAELAQRRASWQAPQPKFTRGYGVLYLKHIQQADTGCDFDFLETEKARDSAGRRARNSLTVFGAESAPERGAVMDPGSSPG